MTFCYARITCVIWLRAGAQYSSTHDIDMPRIHFVTSRRSPAASVPGGCSVRRHRAQEPPPPPATSQRCRSSPRSLLSSPCVGGVPAKMAVTSKRNVVKMTMSVIVGFVVCWTPYFVVSLIRIYSDYRYRLSAGGYNSGSIIAPPCSTTTTTTKQQQQQQQQPVSTHYGAVSERADGARSQRH